jgi:hypothetical protein
MESDTPAWTPTVDGLARYEAGESEVAMHYEATIHFEVKDGSINLTRLIADQKIGIHGRRCR